MLLKNWTDLNHASVAARSVAVMRQAPDRGQGIQESNVSTTSVQLEPLILFRPKNISTTKRRVVVKVQVPIAPL